MNYVCHELEKNRSQAYDDKCFWKCQSWMLMNCIFMNLKNSKFVEMWNNIVCMNNVLTINVLYFQSKEEKAAAEGWEYAPLFTMKFHHKERKMDLVRRRRWHRKMIAEDPRAPCFFKIKCKEVGWISVHLSCIIRQSATYDISKYCGILCRTYFR